MIIDMRVRPPAGAYVDTHIYLQHERTARTARLQHQQPPRAVTDQRWEVFLEEFDASEVDIGVVPGRVCGPHIGQVPNDDVAAMVDESEGRLVGFAAVDVDAPDARDELERAIGELGMVGLAIDPGFLATPAFVDDERLAPLYSACEELGVPVMLTVSGNAGPDIGYADPVRLDRLAAGRPGLTIIVAHAGWPWVRPVLGIAFRRPNVVISPDQYLLGLPGADDWIAAANTYLGDRLLFGSSYPFMPLQGALDYYRAQPLRAEVVEGVLGGNAAQVLGLATDA